MKDHTYISTQLAKANITTTQRSLDLGDAIWIARPKIPLSQTTKPSCQKNMSFPTSSSANALTTSSAPSKSKRFTEQKFRLQRCGISSQNIIYLIEENELSKENREIWIDSGKIATAMAETQMVNGFFAKRT